MKTTHAILLGLALPLASFAQYEPYGGPSMPPTGYQPSYNGGYYNTGYQSGVAMDSGAGLIIIGVIIWFLFFRKSGGSK